MKKSIEHSGRSVRRAMFANLLGATLMASAATQGATPAASSFTTGGTSTALSSTPGSPTRGRALVANRQLTMCLLCHRAPIAEVQFQGDISSDLAGAGGRWSAAQLRARINDPRVENPGSVMPAYARKNGLTRVATAWRDKPILDAQQIEDIVAWLATLK